MIDTEGIAKNIFNIIDACYYKGKDATVLPNPEARNGEYAVVYGPNQEILDTGWSTPGAWVGLHGLNLLFYADSLSDGARAVQIEYWKKDIEGNETLAFSTISSWDPYICDEFGVGVGLIQFQENYQYRIIVKSDVTVPSNVPIAVDYIRILPVYNYGSNSTYIYGVEEIEGAMAVQWQFPEIYTVTGDGSGYVYTATFNVPTDKGQLWTVPVVSVLGNSVFNAVVTEISSDLSSFTIAVRNTDKTYWSGGVNVCCHLHYFPIMLPL
jgi:hypothetical protein